MSARPVTRGQMVATVALASVAWLAMAVAGLFWFKGQWLAALHVQDQALGLSLPTGLRASADVHSSIHTRLKASPRILVPLDQMVTVSMSQELVGTTHLTATVPIDTEVSYAAQVPVKTEVTMEVPIISWLPSMTVTLPLAFSVPVKVSVPFKTNMPVSLDIKAVARVPHALRLPLKGTMDLIVPLNEPLQAEVLSRTQFELVAGIENMPVMISNTTLKMPLSHLSLQGW